jgi:hypothetical protein
LRVERVMMVEVWWMWWDGDVFYLVILDSKRS